MQKTLHIKHGRPATDNSGTRKRTRLPQTIRKHDLVTQPRTAHQFHTTLLSKDNEAARRRLRRRITNTLRKPTTQPTKLAKESEAVLSLISLVMEISLAKKRKAVKDFVSLTAFFINQRYYRSVLKILTTERIFTKLSWFGEILD